VVAATSVLTLLGWSLFAPYVFPAAGLDDRDEDDVRTEVLALLAKMTAAAAPAPSAPGSAEGTPDA
jgi:hypothetical protein